MILHVVHDDKFVDAAYELFEEAAPGYNDYLLLSYRKKPTRFIKKAPVSVVSPLHLLNSKFTGSLKKYDAVIMHWLGYEKMLLLSRLPEEITVIWIGWGSDYYDLIEQHGEFPLHKPLTSLAISSEKREKGKSYLERIKGYVRRLLWGDIIKEELLKKIDYFAPVLQEEHALLNEALPDGAPRFVAWNYLSKNSEKLVDFYETTGITGSNILIGNNAHTTNNHIDTFETLRSISIGERTLIVPLSYGDISYRKKVIECGRGYFGDKFIPILDFMPLEEYARLIGSCSVVIMNQLRQQGIGNLLIALRMGAKVFLDRKNPAFRHFRNMRVHIYDVEEVAHEIETNLSEDQIHENRAVLSMHYNRELALEKTRRLLDKIIVLKA